MLSPRHHSTYPGSGHGHHPHSTGAQRSQGWGTQTAGQIGKSLDAQPCPESTALLRVSPHGPAQLLVGHVAVFFLLAPELGHSLRAQELEDTLVPVLPFHEAFVELRVDEDVPDKLPQVGASGGYKAISLQSVVQGGPSAQTS